MSDLLCNSSTSSRASTSWWPTSPPVSSFFRRNSIVSNDASSRSHPPVCPMIRLATWSPLHQGLCQRIGWGCRSQHTTWNLHSPVTAGCSLSTTTVLPDHFGYGASAGVKNAPDRLPFCYFLWRNVVWWSNMIQWQVSKERVTIKYSFLSSTSRCFTGTCINPARNIHGDNCCSCNVSAILQQTGIDREDIIYASYVNRVTVSYTS